MGPDFHAKHIIIESEDGKYSVSIPLAETMRTALVVYELKKKTLSRDDGGPLRFLIPFSGDACTSVKGAARMTLSEQPGKDTRPAHKRDHEALHAAEKDS